MEMQVNLVYWIMLCILLGLLLQVINKKTRFSSINPHYFSFPYSPMVLFVGLAFGFMQNRMGFLGEYASIMASIHPHLMLYLFIPVLLFEKAFNLDW